MWREKVKNRIAFILLFWAELYGFVIKLYVLNSVVKILLHQNYSALLTPPLPFLYCPLLSLALSLSLACAHTHTHTHTHTQTWTHIPSLFPSYRSGNRSHGMTRNIHDDCDDYDDTGPLGANGNVLATHKHYAVTLVSWIIVLLFYGGHWGLTARST